MGGKGSTDELAADFRREYGRFCTMVALALHSGYDRDLVSDAARGQRNTQTADMPIYNGLLKQRTLVDHNVKAAVDSGAEWSALTVAIGVARTVVGQEWHVELPPFADRAKA